MTFIAPHPAAAAVFMPAVAPVTTNRRPGFGLAAAANPYRLFNDFERGVETAEDLAPYARKPMSKREFLEQNFHFKDLVHAYTVGQLEYVNRMRQHPMHALAVMGLAGVLGLAHRMVPKYQHWITLGYMLAALPIPVASMIRNAQKINVAYGLLQEGYNPQAEGAFHKAVSNILFNSIHMYMKPIFFGFLVSAFIGMNGIRHAPEALKRLAETTRWQTALKPMYNALAQGLEHLGESRPSQFLSKIIQPLEGIDRQLLAWGEQFEMSIIRWMPGGRWLLGKMAAKH